MQYNLENMNISLETNFITENFGNKEISFTPKELVKFLVEYKLKLVKGKAQSIHFDVVTELLDSVNLLKDALETQSVAYKKLLDDEKIPYEVRKEYRNAPTVNYDDIKDKPHILKFMHPKLSEVREKINLVENY